MSDSLNSFETNIVFMVNQLKLTKQLKHTTKERVHFSTQCKIRFIKHFDMRLVHDVLPFYLTIIVFILKRMINQNVIFFANYFLSTASQLKITPI